MKRFSLSALSTGNTGAGNVASSSMATAKSIGDSIMKFTTIKQDNAVNANNTTTIATTTPTNFSSDSRISLPKLSMFQFGEDKTNKSDKTERKIDGTELDNIISILEDVHLQCPDTHTGIVVAYSSAIAAPITYKGIRFTWYRQGNHDYDQFSTVDESFRAW